MAAHSHIVTNNTIKEDHHTYHPNNNTNNILPLLYKYNIIDKWNVLGGNMTNHTKKQSNRPLFPKNKYRRMWNK